MELQCNQTALTFWEPAADLTVRQEESAELIVPDNCPDIARVLSATGNVCLQQSEAHEGKLSLSGTAHISVLYIPEKSQTIQSVGFTVPFQLTENCPVECSVVHAAVMAEEITARTLNPRKLRLQCRLAADVRAYRSVSLSYTSGVTVDPGLALQLLPQQETAELISSLPEQSFTCEETFSLPQNRGAVSSILSTRIHCLIEDAKIIGTKAVVKGRYFADMLVKYDSGVCESSGFELPFSHISEIDAPQTARLTASAVLTNFSVTAEQNEDDGGEARLSVTSRLQLAVSESREAAFIADLYSTVFPLHCEMQELCLAGLAETQLRRQVWQDTLEIGAAAERVLQLSVSCGTVTTGEDAKGTPELRTTLRLTALCLTEDGRTLSAERSAEIALPCPELIGGTRCRAVCGESPTSVITADGILVRVPVDFCLRPQNRRTIRCVVSASLDENAARDAARQPSLVLRRKRAEEDLWSLAKAHGSTMQDILAANGCGAAGELPEGLLLIPRHRVQT